MGPRSWKRSLKNGFFPRTLDLPCAETSRAAGALVCAAVRSACAAVSQRVHSLSLCQSASRPFFTLRFVLTSFPLPRASALVPPFCLAEGREGGCGCRSAPIPHLLFTRLQQSARQTDKDVKEYLRELHRNKSLSRPLSATNLSATHSQRL